MKSSMRDAQDVCDARLAIELADVCPGDFCVRSNVESSERPSGGYGGAKNQIGTVAGHIRR